MPKVSIHMCTYNRAQYIIQAVDSVLIQTCTDFELLILDDASTDNTEEILRPYLADSRIRYIKNERNLGITKNRNKALSLSLGEYVAVLDSDDYWIDKTKLQRQVEFLDTHPKYSLVGTYMHVVDDAGKLRMKIVYPGSNWFIKQLLIIKNIFCHSSVMYRRNEIIDLGGYDESLPIWEDYDLFLRIGLKYKFENLEIYGTAYRMHRNQSNAEKKQLGIDVLVKIMKQYGTRYNQYWLAKLLHRVRLIVHKMYGK